MVSAAAAAAAGQCDDGLFTFEKVTGHFLRSAQQVGLAMASSPGVTLECGARCLEAGSDCPAFSLDYAAMKCFKLDRNTQVGSYCSSTAAVALRLGSSQGKRQSVGSVYKYVVGKTLISFF